jgi:biotin-dependent carboxylase-like uncharacterized protein
MPIEVLKPGLMTAVQDEGRIGTYAVGMPPAGAMDKFSYRVANLLVGNPEGAAALEATYLGPELAFTQDAVIAVTGADMPVKINGDEVAPWTAHEVRSGDVLSFDFLRSGARAYIAVRGGIDVPVVMGSRSTYTLTGMGGFEGRALQVGDELPVGSLNGAAFRPAGVPQELIPVHAREVELRVVVGLSSYRLTPASLAEFFETTWTVTPDANRVGYRYRGTALEFVERVQPAGAGSDPSNVVDIGYPVGSIQVPGGTEPIALLNDAVTGGGYATIATIISSDLDRAGQSKTNDKTRFVEVTLEQALDARREKRDRLERVRAALGAD